MGKPGTLGIYLIAHDLEAYDYPFIEALDSALPIADELVINECGSTDGTLAALQAWAQKSSKVQIVQSEWIDNWRQLAVLGNYCVPFLKTEWAWQLQADEIIHEDSYREIRRRIHEDYGNDPDITAMNVHYTHFVANYETTFPFQYDRLVRIARRGRGWQLIGDACHLAGGDPRGVVDTSIQVFHYGKVHAGSTAWQKEWDFQQLFRDNGFPDPKMQEMRQKLGEQFCDYLYLFRDYFNRGEFKQFEGRHPQVMNKRIAAAKLGGWEQFQSRMQEELCLQNSK